MLIVACWLQYDFPYDTESNYNLPRCGMWQNIDLRIDEPGARKILFSAR